MQPHLIYYTVAAIVTSGSALYALGRLVVGRIRTAAKREVIEEMESSFLYSIATNHLPHLYHALQLICNKLDIEIEDAPAINYSQPTKRPETLL